jgi:hypothetical protein
MNVTSCTSRLGTRAQIRFRRSAALQSAWVVVALVLTACGTKSRHWTEDVLLDDGSTIQVERSIAYTHTSSWSGDASFTDDKEATIRFTGSLSEVPPWSAALRPLLLYRDVMGGEWVIVTTSASCEVWATRGKPNPPYWEFRLRSNVWEETDLSQSSIGRVPNLLFEFRKTDADHITVHDRIALQSDARMHPTYKRIQGTPLKSLCY